MPPKRPRPPSLPSASSSSRLPPESNPARHAAPVRSSALGMAYARGAQAMRNQEALRRKMQLESEDRSSLVLELVVRMACVALQGAVREVCAVRACSRQLCETCSEDSLWEELFEVRWGKKPSTEVIGWRQAFLTRLRRGEKKRTPYQGPLEGTFYYIFQKKIIPARDPKQCV